MSYAALSALKERLSIDDTNNDDILQVSLDWADSFINTYCDRRFSGYTATRAYGPERIDWDDTGYTGPIPLVYGPYKRLFLDDDCLTVTAVLNGDGTSIPADGTGFFLEPFNAAADNLPFQSILLKQAYAWIWTPDTQIKITGTWGWSATPDALIVSTALLLSEWHYRMRAPQDVTNLFDAKTRKARFEGFPESVFVVLDARKRYAK